MSKDCDIEITKSKPKFYAERLKPPKKVKLKDAYERSVEKYRVEGFAEGFVEGFTEGFAEGFAEEFAKGFVEGFAEGTVFILMKLYNEKVISKSVLLEKAQSHGVLNIILKKLEADE